MIPVQGGPSGNQDTTGRSWRIDGGVMASAPNVSTVGATPRCGPDVTLPRSGHSQIESTFRFSWTSAQKGVRAEAPLLSLQQRWYMNEPANLVTI